MFMYGRSSAVEWWHPGCESARVYAAMVLSTSTVILAYSELLEISQRVCDWKNFYFFSYFFLFQELFHLNGII